MMDSVRHLDCSNLCLTIHICIYIQDNSICVYIIRYSYIHLLYMCALNLALLFSSFWHTRLQIDFGKRRFWSAAKILFSKQTKGKSKNRMTELLADCIADKKKLLYIYISLPVYVSYLLHGIEFFVSANCPDSEPINWTRAWLHTNWAN